jgi:hypothetical protein
MKYCTIGTIPNDTGTARTAKDINPLFNAAPVAGAYRLSPLRG